VPTGIPGLFPDGTPACLPLARPADLPVGDADCLPPVGLVPAGDLDSGAAGCLGMAMIALHFGQGPFLPACWSPTVKLVLQPGQVTGIGIHAPLETGISDLLGPTSQCLLSRRASQVG